MALEDKVSMCPKCGSQFLFKPDEIPYENCTDCGTKLTHTNVTAEEMFLIERTSKDKDFINAMIELKKNDIIEYQVRISQFRQQAKADGCYTSPAQKREQNLPKCPTCGSTNIKKISASRKMLGAIGFGLLSKTARSLSLIHI